MAGIDEPVTGIRDRGGSRIGEEDDARSAHGPLDEGSGALLFVVLVEGDEFFAENPEVAEETV